MNDYQDWEYCSVHMSVQISAQMSSQGEELTDVEKQADVEQLAIDALKCSEIGQEQLEKDTKEDYTSTFSKDSFQDRFKDAVEVTSFDGIDDFEDDLEDDFENLQEDFGNKVVVSQQSQALQPPDINSNTNIESNDDSSVDIDIFFPSLLLSFESLLNRMLEDLLKGLKHHDLYSMGLAQYLKLEDEQVDGNAVKLRYRLPIDNIKHVIEAI